MKNYKIVLLPGDGIGPEITKVTKEILKIVSKRHSFSLDIEEKLFGGMAIDSEGIPLPMDTLEACKKSDSILLAAIGDPKYDSSPREKRPESGLLELRKGLELFANIRPVKIRPALIESSTLKPEIIETVDLVVVRELIGGIYFGKPKGKIKTKEGERAFNTMTYSTKEVDRISKIAFDIAKDRRLKVCSIDKANVLDVSQLWRDRVSNLSKAYPEVELIHQYVDNAAMQLIRNPNQFDVILTGNLFGDIISDLAAMLTGSIGMLPSASLSERGPGLYEPVHGSAPDIAGKDIANPIAMILSAAMMLRIGLREKEAANDIENAIDIVLEEGLRTPDLMQEECRRVGCEQMGQEIYKVLSKNN